MRFDAIAWMECLVGQNGSQFLEIVIVVFDAVQIPNLLIVAMDGRPHAITQGMHVQKVGKNIDGVSPHTGAFRHTGRLYVCRSGGANGFRGDEWITQYHHAGIVVAQGICVVHAHTRIIGSKNRETGVG